MLAVLMGMLVVLERRLTVLHQYGRQRHAFSAIILAKKCDTALFDIFDVEIHCN